ncbi:hypothetical protein BaRGS_00013651 [Batillaria attramentaria]|uniref:ATP synthase F(1) complex subunit delta, mitochondrial n=1 Tax=Batillaria attramentaria TaxID=370345 RepID=A0ABD0L672_9CAEN
MALGDEVAIKGDPNEDPIDTKKETCQATPSCAKYKARLDECTERVSSRETEETCEEELFDFVHCVDHCVSRYPEAITDVLSMKVASPFALENRHFDSTTMAGLLRNGLRAATVAQQCTRLLASQQRGYADMAFTFASPSDVYYADAKVKQVDVPSFSGSFGILPSHVPSLAVLKPGMVTVFEEDGTPKKFFVSSGSITINEDSSVQVLAEEAHPLERFDSHAVREGLIKANHELGSATSDRAKAEAQIAVDCYEALQKALDGN